MPDPAQAEPIGIGPDLEAIGKSVVSTRTAADEAMQAARAAGLRMAEQGIAETRIAATLHVDRMTVRKWLGKR